MISNMSFVFEMLGECKGSTVTSQIDDGLAHVGGAQVFAEQNIS